MPSPDPTPAALIDRRRPVLSSDPAGRLLFETVPLDDIAEAIGTPCWVYGAGTIRDRFARLADRFGAGAIHYAVKANDHLAILALMRGLGAGADVVSIGEYLRAREAGFAPDRIVFSGVGKTGDELARAVGDGIGQINVESLEELALLSRIATAAGVIQSVALRINPDVEAGSHDKISTGRAGDKFGIAAGEAERAYALAADLPGLRPVGIAVHIGSQIMQPEPFAQAARIVLDLVRRLRRSGHAVQLVDCGGGLGIGYGVEPDGDPDALHRALHSVFDGHDLRLAIEPGRWLVGPAGLLLATVVRRKAATPHPFLVLDAGMNDLVRPALYEAWHGIVPLRSHTSDGRPRDREASEPCDVVGPVCETGDTLARARVLPRLEEGERVAILDAGAYGAVMSSAYNARPWAAQVLVDCGRWEVIRPPGRAADLWRDERVPASLTPIPA